jgi:hypothetical protein
MRPFSLPPGLALGLALWVLLSARASHAGDGVGLHAARAPVPSGRYEGYSLILRAPYGPLDERTARTLPRWLEVTSQGETSEVVFQPDRRVRWRLTYGPEGLIEKKVTIDGKPWTESRFRYERGALVEKSVTGPGSGGARSYRYVLDESGRLKERRGPISRDPFHGSDPKQDHVLFTWDTSGATVDHVLGRQVVRRDRFDAAGRLLRTDLGRPATDPKARLSLLYQRDAAGRLTGIQRQWFTAPAQPAYADRRDPHVVPRLLDTLPPVVERHEVLLLIGQPVKHSRDAGLSEKGIRDEYSKGCWLNKISELTYDSEGSLSRFGQSCICGFCVAAESEPRTPAGAELLGTDEHWIHGPWLRLDERIDVTPEHRVMTPSGPRPASELRAGDAVLAEDGSPRPLRSVRRLPPGPSRLGVNLRTSTGRFAAGGLLFESETARPCEDTELDPRGM